jgi:hypothetical protein
MAMKKHNHKDQRNVQALSSLRQVKLQALIFGGANPETASLGTSLPRPTNLEVPKQPPAAGE